MKNVFKDNDKVFQAILNILMFAFLCIELYPLLYVVSSSFSDPNAVQAGEVVLLPKGFSLEGYRYVFTNKEIWIGYINTIFYTVAGTLVNLGVTLPCAYALSRRELPYKGVLMVFFMITMYISGGLIPSYLNVKSFGLLDTRTFMLINGALSVYNMIVARTFFASSIPYELTEAAKIDGCNDFQIFGRVVMPLSKSITVVMVLYYGIAHWNNYFSAMIYLKDRTKFPLQLFLREILVNSQLLSALTENAQGYSPQEIEQLMKLAENATLVKFCVIVVSALPLMLIYPKLQKHFEKGVMIGSVKG